MTSALLANKFTQIGIHKHTHTHLLIDTSHTPAKTKFSFRVRFFTKIRKSVSKQQQKGRVSDDEKKNQEKNNKIKRNMKNYRLAKKGFKWGEKDENQSHNMRSDTHTPVMDQIFK